MHVLTGAGYSLADWGLPVNTHTDKHLDTHPHKTNTPTGKATCTRTRKRQSCQIWLLLVNTHIMSVPPPAQCLQVVFIKVTMCGCVCVCVGFVFKQAQTAQGWTSPFLTKPTCKGENERGIYNTCKSQTDGERREVCTWTIILDVEMFMHMQGEKKVICTSSQ